MSPRSERLLSISMADTELFETVNLVAERSEFHKLLPAFTTWLHG